MKNKVHSITPVIMVGGSGDRLWPLSRKSFPKQFNKLLSGQSLFQETIKRFSENQFLNFKKPIIVTNEDYRFIVKEQLVEINVQASNIIVEPLKKNTSPSILAASIIQKDKDSLLLLVPSDHFIKDIDSFIKDIKLSIEKHNQESLIIFGITPTRPETGYGYIQIDDQGNFKNFIEKPNEIDAKTYYKSNNYLWNSGLLMFTPSVLISLFKKIDLDTYNFVTKAVYEGENDLFFFRLDKKEWSKCENISIDFAILEKIKNISVHKVRFKWDDLGDWNAIWKTRNKDESGVVKIGNTYSFKTKNSLIYSHCKDQVLALCNVSDLVVISMRDAVLVANKENAQDVKEVVKRLKENNVHEAEYHKIDYRPWGNFESLIHEKNFQVKKIIVSPNESLSLQKHKYRSENWIVVSGIAKVTVGSDVRKLNVGESVFIAKNTIHRLENEEEDDLILIEVQTGNYLGEDDIIRLDDKYSR